MPVTTPLSSESKQCTWGFSQKNDCFKSSIEISHPEMTQGVAKVRINRISYSIDSHAVTRLETDNDGNQSVKVKMAY